MKRLVFTVTNDLSFDQRMIRICTSLSRAGYDVTLVGIQTSKSIPLISQPFRQKRLNSWFSNGKAFYIEYNVKLFFWLLFKKMDLVCAIDLDTIVPVWLMSKLKNIKRVYDAHELFCEMKEVVTRPRIYRFWKFIERRAIPGFKLGYTVNQSIADEFFKMYKVRYEVIRNLPLLQNSAGIIRNEGFILYQGAVNEGRSFETLIPAMKNVNAQLIICGVGNFMEQAKRLVELNGLEEKVIFKNRVPPDQLKEITRKASIGITLFENKGLSNYLSLGNRFFDYIHAAIPQICVDYPEYRRINQEYEVAVLIDDLHPDRVAKELNNLLSDKELYERLKANAARAREELNWQKEETRLLAFYKKLF